MADFKVVDVEGLELELTDIADEVRILTDTTEKMNMAAMADGVAEANGIIGVQSGIISDIKTVLSDLDDGISAMGEEVKELAGSEEDLTIDTMTEVVAGANDEIGVQTDLIGQLKDVLQGKAIKGKEEQTKSVDITENGSYFVVPDEGYTLSRVSIDVATEDTMRKFLLNELTGYRIIDEFSLAGKRFYWSSLQKWSTPNLTGVDNYCFYQCRAIKYLDLGKITTLNPLVLNGIHSFEVIILRNNSVVNLTGVLNNCNSITKEDYGIYCYFYVPKALVEEYKVATNWSAYAHRFRAIEDYPEEVNYDNY